MHFKSNAFVTHFLETRRKMTQDLGRDKFLELSSFYNFVLSDPAPAHIETCSVLKFGQTIIQMAK